LASIAIIVSLATPLFAAPPPPPPVVPDSVPPLIKELQPGVKLTLLAEHPALVTPTGIDIDAEGNIWLVACHTHFRPQGYAGPAHDEVLIFDRDGKNRLVFYNQTDATMQLKHGPDGWVYLAERDRILRIKDTDGDGVADREENLATLDTEADYPHNGLSGMAWHPSGDLIFSMGENYSKTWTLAGRDGAKVTGSGEGGVFRCTADGAKLRRIARGFWNPFGLLVRADGEIFAAENDPGSRPPCRLLNVIEGADYGYQRVYGEQPIHPFVAWNGELRGTLGMAHSAGEGPCAVVELGAGVIIPSWSNHCIDYYPLARRGAGFTSKRIELVHGSEFFRPVCMTPSRNNTFYLTDWVFSAYAIHNRGRLWKLEIDPAADWIKKTPDPMNDAARLAKSLRDGSVKLTQRELFEHARGTDPYLSDAALTALAREGTAWSPETLRSWSDQDRVWALVALRRVNLNDDRWVKLLLHDANPEVRFECLRWIADANLVQFAPQVERMLSRDDLDFRLFEAVLATWNTLRGRPAAGVTDPEVLIDRITDREAPARLKGFALRLMPTTNKKLKVSLLRELLAVNDLLLSLEVVRTLGARKGEDDLALLAEIAGDESRKQDLRIEAIVGLAASTHPEHQSLLLKLATSDDSALRNESLRALRGATLDLSAQQSLSAVAKRSPDSASLVRAILDPASLAAGRPPVENTAAWLERLDHLPGKADPEVGRRVFFNSRAAICANCHRHGGRGNVVGPDLSLVDRQGDRIAILRSILEPSRDIAPQYFHTILELKDGTIFNGILLRSSSNEVYRDQTGKERTFKKDEIESSTESKLSLMPTGLLNSLTDSELRDLLAFLTSPSRDRD
jgi:putative membrane-bound dehydrogenase-like protein